jgi:hypothetical protein
MFVSPGCCITESAVRPCPVVDDISNLADSVVAELDCDSVEEATVCGLILVTGNQLYVIRGASKGECQMREALSKGKGNILPLRQCLLVRSWQEWPVHQGQ